MAKRGKASRRRHRCRYRLSRVATRMWLSCEGKRGCGDVLATWALAGDVLMPPSRDNG